MANYPYILNDKWSGTYSSCLLYQQSVTVYKSLNELNPHYMNKLFSYTQENHSYGTRNATSSLLAHPKCNKSIGQKCISYSGPKVWNGLTEAIRCAPSLPSFKSRYLKVMYCTTLKPWGPQTTCKHARGPQRRSLPLD